MNKNTLAILGLGSRSTAYYVAELNKIYHQKNGGYSSCPFVLWNTNFDNINSLLPFLSDELIAIMQGHIQAIENLNIEHILVPNITLHECIDQLNVQKNVLHPIHLTIKKIKEQKIEKIVVFGSAHTMTSAYVRQLFESNNIVVEIPTKEDRLQIDAFRKQVYGEEETKEQIENYHQLVEKYSFKYALVLACTELSILKPKANKNLFDMVEIQILEVLNNL